MAPIPGRPGLGEYGQALLIPFNRNDGGGWVANREATGH